MMCIYQTPKVSKYQVLSMKLKQSYRREPLKTMHENELENLDVFYVYRLLSVGLMVGDDVEYMVFGCTRFIAKIVIENQVINFFLLKFDILKKEINEIYVTYRSTIPQLFVFIFRLIFFCYIDVQCSVSQKIVFYVCVLQYVNPLDLAVIFVHVRCRNSVHVLFEQTYLV